MDWLNQTGQVNKFFDLKFFGLNLFLSRHFCKSNIFFWLKIAFWPKKLVDPKIYGPHFFGPNISLKWNISFGPKIFWDPKFFLPKIFPQNLSGSKIHLRIEFDSGVGPTCIHFFLLAPLDELISNMWPNDPDYVINIFEKYFW